MPLQESPACSVTLNRQVVIGGLLFPIFSLVLGTDAEYCPRPNLIILKEKSHKDFIRIVIPYEDYRKY